MTTTTLGPDQHVCPRPGCARVIRRDLFACRPDWFALSPGVRRAIWSTAFRPTDRARLEAIKAALEEWGPAA